MVSVDKARVARKKMVMFFLLDASNSMNEGDKMTALNRCMADAVELAKDLDVKNTEVQIEVAVLMFGVGDDGEECRWIRNEPEPVDRFEWIDQKAEGWTPFSKALDMLNAAMSRDRFLDTPSASMAPVVVVMSDGHPCIRSGDEYAATSEAIERLNRNRWFVNSLKAAIAIGDDADKKVLSDITGKPETVFEVHDSNRLADVIEFIVVRSSVITSTVIRDGEREVGAVERFAEEAVVKHEEDDMNSTGWTTF